MMKTFRTFYRRRAAALAAALTALAAAANGQAQTRQTLSVSLRALPSVSVVGLGAAAQRTFAEEMPRLAETFRDPAPGTDFVTLAAGFSIAAYENIPVLITYSTQAPARPDKGSSDETRVMCGYLNDGTSYFLRAAMTSESPVGFRLRNNGLLKRSMNDGNPLFVAHVFFLVNTRKGEGKHGDAIPAPTVSVEFF